MYPDPATRNQTKNNTMKTTTGLDPTTMDLDPTTMDLDQTSVNLDLIKMDLVPMTTNRTTTDPILMDSETMNPTKRI